MTQGQRAGGGGAIIAPPLGVVTGAVLPGEVAGVFGPASAFSWRGACVGGCGGRPQCREDEPAPECSGCARQRHGVVDGARAPWRPAVHALGPHRVLITGSRTWDDVATLRAELDALRLRYGARLVIVHGHCPDGADALADAWYIEHYGRRPERHPADWPTHRRAAGPIRNSAMVATRPAECLAFIRAGSRGTADCAGKAERAGIPTRYVIYGQRSAAALPTVRFEEPEVLPERWTVLRRAAEVSPHDPTLPRTVRQLAESAPGLRVFAAVAADAVGGVLASVSVRAPGVGYAVYERPEGGSWRFARGAVFAPRPRHRLPARPHLQRANVGRFAAALAGVEYEPPVLAAAEPREAPAKGRCPECAAEVSLTKAGAVYASHKCRSRTVEGRS